jgi:hypothetical protein
MKRLTNILASIKAFFMRLVMHRFFKYHYLDENTRISFGYHFSDLGKSYHLQRKGRYFWKKVAWTYIIPWWEPNLDGLIGYLKWYENKHKEPDCIF